MRCYNLLKDQVELTILGGSLGVAGLQSCVNLN
jgi:hypothetical protein